MFITIVVFMTVIVDMIFNIIIVIFIVVVIVIVYIHYEKVYQTEFVVSFLRRDQKRPQTSSQLPAGRLKAFGDNSLIVRLNAKCSRLVWVT